MSKCDDSVHSDVPVVVSRRLLTTGRFGSSGSLYGLRRSSGGCLPALHAAGSPCRMPRLSCLPALHAWVRNVSPRAVLFTPEVVGSDNTPVHNDIGGRYCCEPRTIV